MNGSGNLCSSMHKLLAVGHLRSLHVLLHAVNKTYLNAMYTIPTQNNDEGGCEFILYRHLPKLVELLNIDSLRVFLRAEEFLSDDDMEMLNPHPPHYVGSKIVETLVKLVRRKGQKGFKKFLSALRKSVDAGYEPGHEDLLNLLEKECKSTTQSAEVNIPQEEEAGDDDPQSNDQVVQIGLEEFHNEPDLEQCLLEDPGGNNFTYIA